MSTDLIGVIAGTVTPGAPTYSATKWGTNGEFAAGQVLSPEPPYFSTTVPLTGETPDIGTGGQPAGAWYVSTSPGPQPEAANESYPQPEPIYSSAATFSVADEGVNKSYTANNPPYTTTTPPVTGEGAIGVPGGPAYSAQTPNN